MKTGKLYSIGVLLTLCLMGFLLAMPGFSGNAQVIETKQSAVAPTTDAKVKLSIPDTPRENLRYLDAALKMYKPVTNYFDGSATEQDTETIYAPLCFLPSEQTGISYPDTWTMGGYMSVKFDYSKLELIGFRCNGNDNQGGYNPAPWDPNLGPLEPNDGTADFSPYHVSAYYFSGAPVIDNPTGHARFFVYAWDIFWMAWPIANYQEVFSRPMGYLIFSRIPDAFADGTTLITVDTNETYSSYYSWPRVPGTLDVWDTSWNVFKVGIQESVGEIGIGQSGEIYYEDIEGNRIEEKIAFNPIPHVEIKNIYKNGNFLMVTGSVVDLLSGGETPTNLDLSFEVNGLLLDNCRITGHSNESPNTYYFEAFADIQSEVISAQLKKVETNKLNENMGQTASSGQLGTTPGLSGDAPGISAQFYDVAVYAINHIGIESKAWASIRIHGASVTIDDSEIGLGTTTIDDEYKFRIVASRPSQANQPSLTVQLDPTAPTETNYNKVYSLSVPAGNSELSLLPVEGNPGLYQSGLLVAVDLGTTDFSCTVDQSLINASISKDVYCAFNRVPLGIVHTFFLDIVKEEFSIKVPKYMIAGYRNTLKATIVKGVEYTWTCEPVNAGVLEKNEDKANEVYFTPDKNFKGEVTIKVKVGEVTKEAKATIFTVDVKGSFFMVEKEEQITPGENGLFTVLGGMRFKLAVETSIPQSIKSYEWRQVGTAGKFYDSYKTDAKELTGDGLKGQLTEVCFENTDNLTKIDTTIKVFFSFVDYRGRLGCPIPIQSRVMALNDKGGDVKMMQSILRMIGVSIATGTRYGWMGTPVAVDGDFKGGTLSAINYFKTNDGVDEDNVDVETLNRLLLHWSDYLKAYEKYPQIPFVKIDDPKIKAETDKWVADAATELAKTLDDMFLAQIQNGNKSFTRESLIRGWVGNEAPIGHWGNPTTKFNKTRIGFRIILGGSEALGSIGFSQIQNKYKYNITDAYKETRELLKDVNLYHPADALKGFAKFSNELKLGGGFYRAFTVDDYVMEKKYAVGEFPKLNYDPSNPTETIYIDDPTDRLSKGIGAYRGGEGYFRINRKQTWPELLREHPRQLEIKDEAKRDKITRLIEYSLDIKKKSGLVIEQRIWTWFYIKNTPLNNIPANIVRRAVFFVGKREIDPRTIKVGGDDLICEENKNMIHSGTNGVCETDIKAEEGDVVILKKGDGLFQYNYSEQDWMDGKKWDAK